MRKRESPAKLALTGRSGSSTIRNPHENASRNPKHCTFFQPE
jgi:hypothetical protein